MSTMADLVYSKSRDESRIGIARVHIPDDWRTKQAFDVLLSSILRQLVKGLADVPPVVEKLYSSHNGETWPCTDELTTSLNQVTCQFAKTFVLIDTLSEPQPFSKFKLRSVILDTLQHLTRTKYSRHVSESRRGGRHIPRHPYRGQADSQNVSY
jgi:hypothetical protein